MLKKAKLTKTILEEKEEIRRKIITKEPLIEIARNISTRKKKNSPSLGFFGGDSKTLSLWLHPTTGQLTLKGHDSSDRGFEWVENLGTVRTPNLHGLWQKIRKFEFQPSKDPNIKITPFSKEWGLVAVVSVDRIVSVPGAGTRSFDEILKHFNSYFKQQGIKIASKDRIMCYLINKYL